LIEDRLGDIYEWHSIVFGPEDLGYYVSRRRLFMIGTKKTTCSFISDMTEFRATFFKAKPVADNCDAGRLRCDMFFGASEEKVLEALEARALQRGVVWDPVTQPLTWFSVLPPAAQINIPSYQEREWQQKRPRLIEAGVPPSDFEKEPTASIKEPRVADFSQTPGERGGRCVQHVPTLLQSSEFWSMNLQRVMLGDEHLGAQGVAVYDDLGNGLSPLAPCPYKRILHELSDSEKRSLAGNAIHIPAFGCLAAFTLASCVPKECISLGRATIRGVPRNHELRCLPAQHTVSPSVAVVDLAPKEQCIEPP
jgi:hypothetical protein